LDCSANEEEESNEQPFVENASINVVYANSNIKKKI
jgi:hypothetical protein